jgi:Icc-related predicted phosphoesterase
LATAYYYCTIAKSDILSVSRREAAADQTFTNVLREAVKAVSQAGYPFLGSYLMAEAIDNAGADLVVHGHAHHGSEKGRTPAGIPVRNVAQPLIRHAYNIYTLTGHRKLRAAAAGGIS